MRNVSKNLSVVNSSSFMWHPGDKTFTSEYSMLPYFNIRRVWDDACDVGFIMQSHRTGYKKVFVLSEVKTSQDGELLWHEFVCADHKHGNIKVKIFND